MKINFKEISSNINNIWISFNNGKSYSIHIAVDKSTRYKLLNNGYTIPENIKLPKVILIKSDNGTVNQIKTQATEPLIDERITEQVPLATDEAEPTSNATPEEESSKELQKDTTNKPTKKSKKRPNK